MIIGDKCLCGGSDYRRALAGRQFSILECSACGLARTYPVPRPDYAGSDDVPGRDLGTEKYARKFAMDIMAKVMRFRRSGRLLDIGSGRGMLLRVASEAGFDAVGVEISRQESKYARKYHNADVVTADFLSAKLSGKFDVLIMNHFLEHIENPGEVLGRAGGLIADDGILFIGLPNYDSAWRRIQGEGWYPYQHTQHIWHYSPRTLGAVLRRNGFAASRVIVTSVEHSLVMQPLNLLFLALGLGDNLNVIARRKHDGRH